MGRGDPGLARGEVLHAVGWQAGRRGHGGHRKERRGPAVPRDAAHSRELSTAVRRPGEAVVLCTGRTHPSNSPVSMQTSCAGPRAGSQRKHEAGRYSDSSSSSHLHLDRSLGDTTLIAWGKINTEVSVRACFSFSCFLFCLLSPSAPSAGLWLLTRRAKPVRAESRESAPRAE